ncbi:MAG: hypothetical protein V3V15_09815 [Sphingorhabdus sp.]
MPQNRSRSDLLKFLDWMSEKGLIPRNTASARKAAANKVLAILSDDEASDVTGLEIDELMLRFSNLKGQNYNPVTVRTYQSRLKSSLDDFRSYCENPVGFRPQGRVQQRTKNQTEKPARSKAVRSPSAASPASAPVPTAGQAMAVLPIRLRENLTVQIGNLPHDLSTAEATRVANVILAYAVPDKA